MVFASLFSSGSPSLLTIAVLVIVGYVVWKYILAPTPSQPTVFGSLWTVGLPFVAAATPHLAKWLYGLAGNFVSALSSSGPNSASAVVPLGQPAVNSALATSVTAATDPIQIHLTIDPASKQVSAASAAPAGPPAAA